MIFQRQRLLRVLNRIFGALALVIGITFTARVLAALLRGLSLRQVGLAGILGLALILVGILYVRAPPVRS
jgi:hypothetical protein